MSKEELAVYHGSLEKDTKKHKGIIDIAKHEKHTERISPSDEDDIPDEVDWRDFGRCTTCTACITFQFRRSKLNLLLDPK